MHHRSVNLEFGAFFIRSPDKQFLLSFALCDCDVGAFVARFLSVWKDRILTEVNTYILTKFIKPAPFFL